MKVGKNRLLSLLSVSLLLAALLMPTVAYALEPNQIEVTISASESVTATDAGEGSGGTYAGEDDATIVPDDDDDGYSYTNNDGKQTDVTLTDDGQEDLEITQTEPEPPQAAVAAVQQTGSSSTTIIPNEDIVDQDTPSDDSSQIAPNMNGIYLDQYTEEGGVYTTDTDAFYNESGDPLVTGYPTGAIEDQEQIEAILGSHGITLNADDELDYLVQVGETVISGDKMVQEVAVTNPEDETVAGYMVTLEAEATRNDQIFDSEGGVNISGKTNIVLTIDITSSMGGALSNTDSTVRWDVLKEAATDFIRTVYGLPDDWDGLTIPNDFINLSLVVYSGGDNDINARSVLASSTGTVLFGGTVTDVNELLSLFNDSATRMSLTGGDQYTHNGIPGSDGHNDMLADHGTNQQAGYIQTASVVDTLLALNSDLSADDIHVVFMTDGEANSYYSNSNTATPPSIANGVTTNAGSTAKEWAAKAAVELLEKGVSLHNIAINGSDSGIASYMDPDMAGGYFNNLLDNTDGVEDNQIDYSLLNNVNYTWADSAAAVREVYHNIAQQIINDAMVAQEARIIDVVPAGFDIYFEDGNADLKVVGVDADGNTIIEWYIGDMKDGVEHSTRYFLVPNSELGDIYSFGTAYTNDSAILFAKPVANGGEEIAVVLDRPAVVIDPYADDDTVQENYNNNGFRFNLLDGSHSGASSGSIYNLLNDSEVGDKLQAVGTSVSDVSLLGVTNAVIGGLSAPVTPDGSGGFSFGNGKVSVHVAADGSVTYERLGVWDEAWGDSLHITFDYSIGFLLGETYVPLTGSPDPAHASATITLQAPVDDKDDDDDDDDNDDIPLSPGNPDIPLGIPSTGGALAYSAEYLFASLAAIATFSLRRKKN